MRKLDGTASLAKKQRADTITEGQRVAMEITEGRNGLEAVAVSVTG